jgi:type I restriction enzyme M protein
VAEIAANDYNLNIPRYIDSTEAEDLHDIETHLLGGISNYDIDALDLYWQVFPTLKQQLFRTSLTQNFRYFRDVVYLYN